jgi:hypothetical protein
LTSIGDEQMLSIASIEKPIEIDQRLQNGSQIGVRAVDHRRQFCDSNPSGNSHQT